MYAFKKSKKFLNVLIKFEDFLSFDGDHKEILYEDDFFEVTHQKVSNLLSSYDKNYFYVDEFLSINITLNEVNPRTSIINQNIDKSIYQQIFPIETLIRPLFLKNIYKTGTILKPYQKEGIAWLLKSKNRLLADDMGLGKTLQALGAAGTLISSGSIKCVLIVCPSTLVYNWCNEINLWLPNFNAIQITNVGKIQNKIWKAAFGKAHFIITNYEHIRNIPKIILEEGVDLIIADEAHKLRKSSSLISKAIKKIKSNRFWALTGTPIEKNQADLINLLSIIDRKLNPVTLRTLSNFSLRAKSNQYILRRMKKDVLSEGVTFNEQTHLLELNETQRTAYNKSLKQFISSKSNDQLRNFNSLKQICDIDPLSLKSTKIDFILELVEKIITRDEKCVIFSFWLLPLEELKNVFNRSFNLNFSEFFHGGLDKEQRENALSNFKNKKDCTVLLCSGKIGGEGINLTEANHVIFFNEWWNPSNNLQARDRVIRIGQSKKSYIHHLRTMNTIEQRIDTILKSKNEINNDVIQKMVEKLKKEII